jgi:hypothetical protein
MAYDLNAYVPPTRGYLVERAQSPAYRGRRPDQAGFDSVQTAHDDYLDQDHALQSRPIADKQTRTTRGNQGREESRRREPSRPGETRLGCACMLHTLTDDSSPQTASRPTITRRESNGSGQRLSRFSHQALCRCCCRCSTTATATTEATA